MDLEKYLLLFFSFSQRLCCALLRNTCGLSSNFSFDFHFSRTFSFSFNFRFCLRLSLRSAFNFSFSCSPHVKKASLLRFNRYPIEKHRLGTSERSKMSASALAIASALAPALAVKLIHRNLPWPKFPVGVEIQEWE